jgi:hypothetical protein
MAGEFLFNEMRLAGFGEGGLTVRALAQVQNHVAGGEIRQLAAGERLQGLRAGMKHPSLVSAVERFPDTLVEEQGKVREHLTLNLRPLRGEAQL